MKKYVLIPDSFKGSLSSTEFCRIAEDVIHRLDPQAAICTIPVADGGEGTVDAFLAAVGGRRVPVTCTGPSGNEISAFYGMLPDGAAVVEMAAAAGLPLMGDRLDPEAATTYGVGQMIAHAAAHGAARIVLGLGGSATNDGGCGAAAAVGIQFFDKAGKTFVPTGGTLQDIHRISCASVSPLVRDIPFLTMCDIDNPLCGETGASAVFGPQKGADTDMVRRLDDGLRHLSNVIRRDIGIDILTLLGSGAAGGFGGGSVAFFNSQLCMGIDAVLDLVHFDEVVRDADLVITGEGRLDGQSLRGKTVIGVARRCKQLHVPVVALVGSSDTDIEAVYELGVSGVFPINPTIMPLQEALLHCEENLGFTVSNLIRFVATLQQRWA